MLRNFIKNISIYGILPIVGKFLNFLLVPVYTKVFTPEEYGIIDLYEAFVFFLLVLASLEIPTAMGRYFYDDNSMAHRRKIVNTSLGLTVLITILVIVVAFVFKQSALKHFLGGTDQNKLFIASMIWLFSLSMNTFLSFIPRYDNRPKVYVTVGVIAITIKILFSILFVVIIKVGLMGVLYGYIFGNTASMLMYAWMSRQYFKAVFSLGYAKKMLMYALPLLFGVVLMEVWKPWLRHMLTLYFPIAVVGLYAFSIRLTSVNIIVHGAFKVAWKPLLFEKKGDFVKGDVLKRISGLVAMASILMGCFITCFAKEATVLIGREEYLSSVQLTGLLVISGIIQMICELRGFAPYISDKTYWVTIANVVAIVAASAFMMIVKDSLGVFGIGFTCIIYDLICYLILVIYTRIKYRIAMHNLWEIPMLMILGCCVFISSNAMQLRFRLLAAVVAFLYTAFIFFRHYYKLNIKLMSQDR